MAPPPDLTLSQWADSERRLSPEASAEPGQWDTSRAEYQRGVMDAISDPANRTVVIVKGSQVGYTEIINNACGYYMAQDPCPILVIQPSIELAETWSKDRLAPMIRDTPTLQGKVADPKSRDSNNAVRQKVFPGGRLTIVGANAPRGLAARPIRLVLADEVDGYPASAGTEGDPLALAAKRQITFWNRKTILGSTPLRRDTSVIWRHWLRSDMRRYLVPCPHCDHRQSLKWTSVKWDEGKPSTAAYVCEECGAIWNDFERWDAIGKGEWRADNPSVTGVAGFHLPGLLSPWLTLSEVVTEYEQSKGDPFEHQVWTNTILGEPYDEMVETIDGTGLVGRCENYGPESVPDGVRIVVAGVDVQNNRLEVQVVGFGANEETWAIAYEIIYGDPAKKDIWDDLDEYLLTKFHSESGRELRIRAACVDSGGLHTAQVLAYCRHRRARRIWAIKGAEGPRPMWPRRASKTQKGKDDIFIVGVDTGKDATYGRLRILKHGPGYIHFPVSEEFDQKYFDQLTAEQVETKLKDGRPVRRWVLRKGRRNEALDTFVYALAARASLAVRLDKFAPAPSAPAPEPVEDGEARTIGERAPLPPALSGVKHSAFEQGGWMNRGRGWWDR